ncbi:ABC transporter substrate-binding protein [Ferrimicrobium sp.]|uniref:ABC transporter substrate-binding protein n=1 Tax=Ferrimicrobium sp. TaxID=2926050 RepID=UPI002628CE38|nr:ABC transporter substrate-binding protein [Ferrimicrobium sp.]
MGTLTSLGKVLVPADGSFIPTGITIAVAYAYNSKVTKNPPTSWSSLLTPAWKGAIEMDKPAISGPTYTAVASIMQQQGGVTRGGAYFKKRAANGLHINSTNTVTRHALLPGVIGIDGKALKAQIAETNKFAELGSSLGFSFQLAVLNGFLALILGTVIARRLSRRSSKLIDKLLGVTVRAAIASPGLVLAGGCIFPCNVPMLSSLGIDIYGTVRYGSDTHHGVPRRSVAVDYPCASGTTGPSQGVTARRRASAWGGFDPIVMAMRDTSSWSEFAVGVVAHVCSHLSRVAGP